MGRYSVGASGLMASAMGFGKQRQGQSSPLRFIQLIKSRHHAQNIVSTAAPRASQLNQALFRKITID
ncbi:hypothetical protein FE789_31475 [Burkholderia pseudomallei]|nr:hypothetical protein FE789_31475 [Burkholderia pseudomallei]